MAGVAVKQIDLIEREKGVSFLETWGVEPPKTFKEANNISRILVNRMAWILSEEQRLEGLVRQHTNSLNTAMHGMESHMAANHIGETEETRNKMRTMREQAECDIVAMFPFRNLYRTRDMVMQEVNRVLAQRSGYRS